MIIIVITISFRPVLDSLDAVDVKVQIALQKILELDAKGQVIVTSIWKRLVSVCSVKKCSKTDYQAEVWEAFQQRMGKVQGQRSSST